MDARQLLGSSVSAELLEAALRNETLQASARKHGVSLADKALLHRLLASAGVSVEPPAASNGAPAAPSVSVSAPQRYARQLGLYSAVSAMH